MKSVQRAQGSYQQQDGERAIYEESRNSKKQVTITWNLHNAHLHIAGYSQERREVGFGHCQQLTAHLTSDRLCLDNTPALTSLFHCPQIPEQMPPTICQQYYECLNDCR